MTHPRQIVPGRTHFVTRRCTQRQFLLRPSDEVNQIYLYCLGEAAQRFGVTLHAWTLMSNHEHLIVRDNKGNLPEFLAHLHKMVAKALNAHWDRRENLWSNEQVNVVHLIQPSDAFEKLTYTLANPVIGDLVELVRHWPGVSSYGQHLSGKPQTVARPAFFRSKGGKMPETVTLRAEKLDGFENLTHEAYAKKIAADVESAEHQARTTRTKPVVGRRAILNASPTSTPRTPAPKTRLNPHLACKDDTRRIDAIRALVGFRAAYRRALERWRRLERKVLFPFGTYGMRVSSKCRVDDDPRSLTAK